MSHISPEVQQQLDALRDKFKAMGQDLDNQLEGVVHAKPVNYWDYIQTDALLNLQTQRTLWPDEMVFIMYHQINELLFKMILWEIRQIGYAENLTTTFFSSRLERISRYFDMLSGSFTIMREGMDMEQYLKFRQTLSPASGFQSAQYRLIEFASTDIINLVDARFREKIKATDSTSRDNNFYKTALEHLYWQAAGKDYKTGSKSYTLSQFEERYRDEFLRFMKEYESINLYARYKTLPEADRNNSELHNAMRHLDHTINIKWVMSHYRAAKYYLNQGKEPLEATGGSDWAKYMHPRYQRRIFFPDVWTEEEKENWGKHV